MRGYQRGPGLPALRRSPPRRVEVGSADDRYEREARTVASRVMARSGGAVGQRCGCVSGMCPTCRTHDGEAGRLGRRVHGRPHAALGSLGAGRALDRAERGFFESRLGASLGHVRIHDDARARETAASLGARGVTSGSHVLLGDAAPSPHTSAGRELMAHELTHTVQQGSGDAGVPSVQLDPVPQDEALADFAARIPRAIAALQAGNAESLGPSVRTLLTGAAGHVSQRDGQGRLTHRGGWFEVAARTFTGQNRAFNLRIVVDDRAAPGLGAMYQPGSGRSGTITVFPAYFRGEDRDLGGALFHETVHAILHMRRLFGDLSFGDPIDAELEVSRHDRFRETLTRHFDRIIPGDARIADVVDSLVEEVIVVVETEAHAAVVDRILAPRSTFRVLGPGYLFRAGHLLTPADETAITGDSYRAAALSRMIAFFNRYAHAQYSRRARRMAPLVEGLDLSRTQRPPIDLRPTLPHRSFIPNLTRSIDEGPF